PAPPLHESQRASSRSSLSQADHFVAGQNQYHDMQEQERLTAEALMDEVEHEVRTMRLGSAGSPSIHVDATYAPPQLGHHYDQGSHDGRNGSFGNGTLTPDIAYGDYHNESDAVADAGIEALRIAQMEDAESEARRLSGSSGHQRYGSYPPPQQQQDRYEDSLDESDGPPVDLSAFEGGFTAPFTSYGGAPEQLNVAPEQLQVVDRNNSQSYGGSRSQPPSSQGSLRRSHPSDTDFNEYDDNIHPFPPFGSARTDTGGTGGFQDPSKHQRRLSYDEGDETGFLDDQSSYPDMFYHPGPTNRPLPAVPAENLPAYSTGSLPYPSDSYNDGQVPYPSSSPAPPPHWAPENYIPSSASNPNVPRSTSLLAHNTQPQALPLPRSRTDAEERERKWRLQQNRKSAYVNDSASDTPATASAVALDLPTLPSAKRYTPTKLGTKDYNKCTEPWALSGLVAWLKLMTEGEQDLRKQGLVDGLVQLFTAKVPTMNIADAETLAAKLIAEMQDAGVLVLEEEWLKFSKETMTGVVYQLTGTGCYSQKLHVYNTPGRCYSHHCQRTLKKLDLNSQPALKQTDDWQSYYKIKKEDIGGISDKEVERQNILHEIVQKEDKYMDDLDVLRVLYRDALHAAQPPIVNPQRLSAFLRDVFGKADAVKKANEDFLLPQLKYRQREQGPWIVGFSDIFREWIRKAKAAYIAYAASFPNANFRIRKEAEKNPNFRSFLDKTRSNPLSFRLSWDTYLKVPLTKLQQYGLLLETVLRRSTVDNDEKRNLRLAINEIKEVTHECDAQVAQHSRKVDLKDLMNKLKLRPGMEMVELNLDHLGRELLFKGDLQRIGANRFTWLETHALLFDHYLVLAKISQDRDQNNVRIDNYDVSRLVCIPCPHSCSETHC
ncbi:MAG: hypothetical protein INR71_01950, partial [Terriglobus roseus]|nr:hypothetical protein [Terriglobus roseus]